MGVLLCLLLCVLVGAQSWFSKFAILAAELADHFCELLSCGQFPCVCLISQQQLASWLVSVRTACWKGVVNSSIQKICPHIITCNYLMPWPCWGLLGSSVPRGTIYFTILTVCDVWISKTCMQKLTSWVWNQGFRFCSGWGSCECYSIIVFCLSCLFRRKEEHLESRCDKDSTVYLCCGGTNESCSL